MRHREADEEPPFLGPLVLDPRDAGLHALELPPVDVGCHAETRLRAWETQQVSWIREAYANDESIEWRRIHKLPDYVRNFPHHVHINAGVSCFSCHGQIIGMPVVYQTQSLAMGWCLDCHRDPGGRLVPPDKVTDLIWVEQDWMSEPVDQRVHEGVTAQDLLASLRQAPPQNCGACHH